MCVYVCKLHALYMYMIIYTYTYICICIYLELCHKLIFFFFFFYLINQVISATLFSAIFLKYYWYEYICCAQYDVQLLGFELQCQRKWLWALCYILWSQIMEKIYLLTFVFVPSCVKLSQMLCKMLLVFINKHRNKEFFSL